jgi:hypothetical protein
LRIADDVDDDILLEGLAEFDGQTGDQRHRFRIVAIDMEDRRFGHLEDVGAVQRRTIIARIGGGETDLVVHHDMHRAAHPVTAGLREVEHFLVDALAGDGRVAVNQHGSTLSWPFSPRRRWRE